jgi:hypothetical protein
MIRPEFDGARQNSFALGRTLLPFNEDILSTA